MYEMHITTKAGTCLRQNSTVLFLITGTDSLDTWKTKDTIILDIYMSERIPH